MRMLVASDLHGSLPALEFLAERARVLAPDLLLLLGDLVYHGPRNPFPKGYDASALIRASEALESMPCSLLAVRGNCDAEVDLTLLPFRVTSDAWLSVDNFDMYACHGHRIPENPPIPGIKPGMTVIRGHTHVPRAETIGGIHIWNPGSLSLPKEGYPPSYGLYDSGKFHIFSIDGRELLSANLEQ